MNTPQNHDPKKVYLLPNLMTAGNLLCGFSAILQIFEGTILRETDFDNWVPHYQNALFFILAAFVFDMLDGRLARLGGRESAFGREFDSLADLISFGVAPALLVFKIVLYEMPARIGWIIAFIYLACGALRLARFNVMASLPPEDNPKKEFTGFPIPAAAGLTCSITLTLLQVYADDLDIGNWKYILAALMLFLSFMMFSKYRYPSFKTMHWHTKWSIPALIVGIIVIVTIITYYAYALSVVFLAYLLYGFFRPYISKAWIREIEEDVEEDL
jgi:CDP-diacylglycerol--serine O-phosphatidyltransferase